MFLTLYSKPLKNYKKINYAYKYAAIVCIHD